MTANQKSFMKDHMGWIIPTVFIIISAVFQLGMQMERQKATDEMMARLSKSIDVHEKADIRHWDANYTDLWRLADELNSRWHTNIKIQSEKQ